MCLLFVILTLWSHMYIWDEKRVANDACVFFNAIAFDQTFSFPPPGDKKDEFY